MARKKSKSSTFPLLDYIDHQMAKLQENLPLAIEKLEEESIHDARVATRRLKSALDLMEGVLTKRHREPLADGLKKLRRRLGPLRDADVLVDHLRKLEKEAKFSAAAGWLRSRVEADREDLRSDARGGKPVHKHLRRIETWPMVRAEISEAREAADTLLAESLHKQTDIFCEQADQLVRELVKGNGDAKASTGDASPRQNPHDLRIAGKALRYTLEMADAQGHSPGAPLLRTFKRMQDQLGSWHDYVVLADRAMQEVVQAELTHQDAAASERLLEFTKVVVRLSSKELAAFGRLWQTSGEKLAAKIRSAFPLTRSLSVAAPETDVELELAETDALDNASTRSETDRDLFETAPQPVPAVADSDETPAA